MSNVSKRRREGTRTKIKSMGDHKEFLKRISKTLYYGQLPSLPCLSLPLTEISCSLWSVSQRGRSLRRLHADEAASIARSACVSPCALVLAILYLERLNACNPDYLAAADPAQLFLVSLMVGNKFLQDDGEDDEVVCSEWAVSGGIELKHLKRLELDFLNAIEWKVYVSEDAFQERLQWLERQVALKQARLRGFFTYSDLAASCDPAPLASLLHSLSVSCLALSLGYVTSLMTLVTSTLVVSQAWLPMLQYVATSRHALSTQHADVITTNMNTELPVFSNATLEDADVEEHIAERLSCCARWQQHVQTSARARSWHDTVVVRELKHESWWSTTSVLSWLYQSSLIDPLQRWLHKIEHLGQSLREELVSVGSERKRHERCEGDKSRESMLCVREWLNLSKVGALLATVSDR